MAKKRPIDYSERRETDFTTTGRKFKKQKTNDNSLNNSVNNTKNNTEYNSDNESINIENNELKIDHDIDEDKYKCYIDQLTEKSDWTELFSVDNLYLAQQNDPFISVIYRALQGDTALLHTISDNYAKKFRANYYKINQQKLVEFDVNGLNINRKSTLHTTTNWRLWIPSPLRYKLIKYYHDHQTNQHAGRDYVHNKMKTTYYWLGMKADITDYVAACRHCQIAKATSSGKGIGPANNFPCERPFQMIAVDLVGPLSTTHDNNSYLLTIIDRFSRYVKAIPIREITAECIVFNLLNSWIYEFGTPEQILSDRGSQFTSTMFKVLCKTLGIKKLYTTAYHPECNGMIERFHRYLKERLRVIASEKNIDFINDVEPKWDIFVPSITYAYNNNINRMTQKKPSDIIFGNISKFPDNKIWKKFSKKLYHNTYNENKDATQQYNTKTQRVQSWINDMNQYRNFAVDRTVNNNQQYINSANKNKPKIPNKIMYKIGDSVIIKIKERAPGNIGKITNTATSIVKITKMKGTTFWGIDIDRNKEIGPLNINKIGRKFHEPKRIRIDSQKGDPKNISENMNKI